MPAAFPLPCYKLRKSDGVNPSASVASLSRASPLHFIDCRRSGVSERCWCDALARRCGPFVPEHARDSAVDWSVGCVRAEYPREVTGAGSIPGDGWIFQAYIWEVVGNRYKVMWAPLLALTTTWNKFRHISPAFLAWTSNYITAASSPTRYPD